MYSFYGTLEIDIPMDPIRQPSPAPSQTQTMLFEIDESQQVANDKQELTKEMSPAMSLDETVLFADDEDGEDNDNDTMMTISKQEYNQLKMTIHQHKMANQEKDAKISALEHKLSQRQVQSSFGTKTTASSLNDNNNDNNSDNDSDNDNDNKMNEMNEMNELNVINDMDEIVTVKDKQMKPRVIEKKKPRPRWKWNTGDEVAVRIQYKWMKGFVKRHWSGCYEVDYIAHKMKLKGKDVKKDGVLRDIHLVERIPWDDDENIDDIHNVTLFPPPEFIE